MSAFCIHGCLHNRSVLLSDTSTLLFIDWISGSLLRYTVEKKSLPLCGVCLLCGCRWFILKLSQLRRQSPVLETDSPFADLTGAAFLGVTKHQHLSEIRRLHAVPVVREAQQRLACLPNRLSSHARAVCTCMSKRWASASAALCTSSASPASPSWCALGAFFISQPSTSKKF